MGHRLAFDIPKGAVFDFLGERQATTRATRLAELVFRFRSDARGVAKESHEAAAFGLSGTLLEKVRSGFNDTHLFGDSGRNPLANFYFPISTYKARRGAAFLTEKSTD